MSCERMRELMAARIDDELTENDLRELEAHLSECESCRRELDDMEDLRNLLGTIELPRPSEEEMMNYWPSVYARIERGMGWSLLVVGLVIWVGYGIFAFITSPGIEALTKLLIALPVVGMIMLLISVIRERYYVSRNERYGEVER
jgi:predicted anti-sigma-YlaC factor YlaD